MYNIQCSWVDKPQCTNQAETRIFQSKPSSLQQVSDLELEKYPKCFWFESQWTQEQNKTIYIPQGKSRWHSHHVLVFISPVLTYVLGTVPCTLTMVWVGSLFSFFACEHFSPSVCLSHPLSVLRVEATAVKPHFLSSHVLQPHEGRLSAKAVAHATSGRWFFNMFAVAKMTRTKSSKKTPTLAKPPTPA